MAEITKQDFEKRLSERFSGLSWDEEKAKIMLAYKFAELGHNGQVRDGGEPYFEHPKRAALILIDELCIADADMIAGALLHDIKEDSDILTWEEIELSFGPIVKSIVETLTKDKSLPKHERDEKYMKKLRNANEAIKAVKLADRLDNLRTLKECIETKQLHIIRETQEHYLSIFRELKLLKLFPQILREMEKIIKDFGFTDSGTQIKNILSFSIPCGYEGCNKEAIHIDIDEQSGKVKVINREGILKAEDVKKLIYLLQNDVSEADKFLGNLKQNDHYVFEDGLYNFCQECDCAYCDEHHDSRIVWEEEWAWYDYTLWICPKKHEHIVDD